MPKVLPKPTSTLSIDEAVGPLQLRVMRFIWKNGPSTVHDVHDALNSEGPPPTHLAYTTILTVMRNLARRKFLDQTNKGQRFDTFVPLVTREAYTSAQLSALCHGLFDGDKVAFTDAVANNYT